MKYVHFIGIGGAGMSGLAEILLERGVKVSGSDLAASPKTRHLKKCGANIFLGEHNTKFLNHQVDTVVYSSAIDPDNPELIEARKRGNNIYRRAEFLAMLTKNHLTIAIAGTHGKTTTTAMIAHLLTLAGADPLICAGAALEQLGFANGRAGSGMVAVVEADEYDRSFLTLTPYIAVLTSLEKEHLDIYKDLDDLENTFAEFANKRSPMHELGFAVVNIDEPSIRRILPKLTKRIVSFGLESNEAKYKAADIAVNEFFTTATILRANEPIGEITLRVPGEHNIKNALAAIAVADILAIPFELTAQFLSVFGGATRRFERIGEHGGVLVIDDYAHHPTELRATLSTLRKGFPRRKIIAAFQPHTYTRTRDFADEFGAVLAEFAGELYLAEIYPAREVPIPGVTSKLILDVARAHGLRDAHLVENLDTLAREITADRKPGDIIITLGAGSITKAAYDIDHILRNLHKGSEYESNKAIRHR